MMKLKALFAAALVVIAGAAPVVVATPAEAQARTVVTERTVVRTDTRRPGYRNGIRRSDNRRYRNNGRYNNRRYATRQVCTNRYRDGRRIRTCRTVRRR